jgi:Ca2+-binding EF-hand superfamily protein
MRTTAYCVFALLVLPAAVLVGAQKVKKLKPVRGDAPPATQPASEAAAPETKEAAKAAKTIAKHDRDGDGKLDADELTTKWRGAAMLFDRDGDGKLDARELTEYLEEAELEKRARKADKARKAKAEAPAAEAAPAPRAPVVYRPGRLPAGLPGWFAKSDTDRDGQVGLYEWKEADRGVEEFLKLDQNEDGFLTPEEVLRAQRAAK